MNSRSSSSASLDDINSSLISYSSWDNEYTSCIVAPVDNSTFDEKYDREIKAGGSSVDPIKIYYRAGKNTIYSNISFNRNTIFTVGKNFDIAVEVFDRILKKIKIYMSLHINSTGMYYIYVKNPFTER